MKKVELLDCTLRDGAYIVESKFGTSAMKGIIKKLQDADVDIIECGWLKMSDHVEGTSFFHLPEDAEQYIIHRSKRTEYVAMIDWDRYDVDILPECDGKSLNAIRVVFPHGKCREGIEVAQKISQKGYSVYLQAANTLAYSDDDLIELAQAVNELNPVCLSVVDTFGAMFEEDLEHIISILDQKLNSNIKLGFHSHNNQQLSFALSMYFVNFFAAKERCIIVDASLCGMGRGAGNATTELIVNFLNKKYHMNYDMNSVLDAIDTYMEYFKENYTWGYSTPYFIAGMYCCHVNNIAYLQKNHRTNSKDMKNIIDSLSPSQRLKYDYDILEDKYLQNQNRVVDDEEQIRTIVDNIGDRPVLLLAPGKSIETECEKIKKYIKDNNPIVVGINSINSNYAYDYLFFINSIRYDYAKSVYKDKFEVTDKILLSSIKTQADDGEFIINFSRVVKCGWEHFDNAVINFLRLLAYMKVDDVKIAGFDGFKTKYNESYADSSLPTLNPDNKWDELNEEIKEMYSDFVNTNPNMNIEFVTESIFEI